MRYSVILAACRRCDKSSNPDRKDRNGVSGGLLASRKKKLLQCGRGRGIIPTQNAGVVELADARDSKSRVRKDVRVRPPPPAPRQNKAARSYGGTSTATLTGDLVFPFPSQTHSVGLCDGIGSDMDCSGAPNAKGSPGRVGLLRSVSKNYVLHASIKTHFVGLLIEKAAARCSALIVRR